MIDHYVDKETLKQAHERLVTMYLSNHVITQDYKDRRNKAYVKRNIIITTKERRDNGKKENSKRNKA